MTYAFWGEGVRAVSRWWRAARLDAGLEFGLWEALGMGVSGGFV